MIVKDVMSSHVATVNEQDTVSNAAEIMCRHDIGVLPVMKNGNKLVGMLTDRDIVLRCVADKRDQENCKVGEIMTSTTLSIDPNKSLAEALQMMSNHQVKRLAVTEDGKLSGIVSLSDIARIRSGAETAKALCEISMP